MKKLIFVCILLFSFKGAISEAADSNRQLEEKGRAQIVLGQKLENPYSIQNMREAFSQYNLATKNSPFEKRLITATHKYVKITPSTEAHLIALEKIDAEGVLILHDMPLDYEIVQEGDYYVNPKNESDLFHPVYTVMPITYALPSGLPFTVLEQVYEPNEDEYVVETIALDTAGWSSEVDCIDSRIICEQPVLKSGTSNSENEKLFGKRYRPHGYVKVRNTENNQSEPLRQAKISIGRGIWWRYTHTDDNGYFSSPKKYRGKVRIRAKWRSNIATIRKSWNEMLGIQVSDHLMTFTRGSNGRTKYIEYGDDRLWYKGTVHNGLVKYNDYAATHGINKPITGANIWVWKNGDNVGATPMLNEYGTLPSLASISGIGQSQLWDVLVNGISAYIINLVPRRLRPDMIFSGLKNRNRTMGSVNTAEIEQLVFHESGHFSHAKNTSSWHWSKLFASELSNMVFHNLDPYVDGSQPSFTAAKQIGLAEGWATVVEFKAMDNLYQKAVDGGEWIGDDPMNTTTVETYIDDFDMRTVPMPSGQNELDGWFLHGLFWDVVDGGTESLESQYLVGNSGLPGILVSNADNGKIIDMVFINNPATLFPIFRYLKSDVYTPCDFGAKLVGGYPADGPEIEDLFHSYGFTCVQGGTGIVSPGVPSGFNITNYSNGNNFLDWNPVSGATYYRVYSSSSYSGTYYSATTRYAPTTSWSTYVANNLYFKVRACNSAGCGGYTSPRLARPTNTGDDCDFTNNQLRISRDQQLIPIDDCPIQ